MKQKTLRYFLFAGVALVWGTIIYKIISGLNDTPVAVKASTKEPEFISENKQDSFILFANYSDPFLPDTTGNFIDTIKAKAPQAENNFPVAPLAPPDLSFIQYQGMIANSEKKKKIAMINLKGQDLLVHEKEKIGEIQIRKIEAETLSILFKGKSHRIRKIQ